MNQGIMGPSLEYPFLIPRPICPAGLTEKSAIYTIMKGLRGFPPKSAPQTVVCRGFNGTSPVPHAFQFSPEAGAPGTAAEEISLVLIGVCFYLESRLRSVRGAH
jgi:hypothetical protein